MEEEGGEGRWVVVVRRVGVEEETVPEIQSTVRKNVGDLSLLIGVLA